MLSWLVSLVDRSMVFLKRSGRCCPETFRMLLTLREEDDDDDDVLVVAVAAFSAIAADKWLSCDFCVRRRAEEDLDRWLFEFSALWSDKFFLRPRRVFGDARVPGDGGGLVRSALWSTLRERVLRRDLEEADPGAAGGGGGGAVKSIVLDRG